MPKKTIKELEVVIASLEGEKLGLKNKIDALKDALLDFLELDEDSIREIAEEEAQNKVDNLSIS